MKIGVIGVVALALLASAGCGGGQSAADKAKSQACDASSDIQAQVDTLKGLPLSPDSVDKAKTALQKINSDLDTIATAAPTVKGDLGSQLKDCERRVQDPGAADRGQHHLGPVADRRGHSTGIRRIDAQ